MARDLEPLIRPDCVLFAGDREKREIGFAITIPDVNVILKRIKDRLLPVGWLRLLRGGENMTPNAPRGTRSASTHGSRPRQGVHTCSRRA